MGRWLQLVMLSAREALVFITGATTLSLEVLASRVMTPYFGVSLYIWASILATTLAFLALGYGAGGLVSRRCDAKTLRIGFFSAPIVAACAMVLACAVYPVLFVRLAQADLVVGSFVASTFLLAVPLILFSAMNPLLVSLEQKDHPGAAAGRVFFISTLGSVLGVLVTAFAMIPYLTNFRGILLTAIVVLVATVMISRDLAPVALRSIRIAAALVGGLALALAIGRDSYLAVLDAGNPQSGRYRIVDESTSVFGNVKIVERLDRNRMPVERILLQEGLVQNRVGPNQESLSPYTDVLSALARRHHSKPDAVLILGLGAGIVAEELARTDWRVTAVEINADTAELAKRYFGLGDRVRTVVADARTFVRGCPGGPYPVVIVDLFQGDFAPDYLFTREFFSDVSHCAGPKGKVIMNVFLAREPGPNERLLATVGAAFSELYRYVMPLGNGFVVGHRGPHTLRDVRVDLDTTEFPSLVRRTLGSEERVILSRLATVRAFSDEENDFSVEFAQPMLENRRGFLDDPLIRILAN